MFSPYDIFWGQLAGCMECINAGTTTVVDHSHLNYAEEHRKSYNCCFYNSRYLWTDTASLTAKIAIAATTASGLRSVYGYCFTGRVDSWSPFALNPSFIAPFALSSLKSLAASTPYGDGRVTLGVAFDGWFLPHDMIKELFQEIKKFGIKHITTHNSPSPPG